MSDIKPCPFCGCEAELHEDGFRDKESYDIRCTDGNCYLSYGAGWRFSTVSEARELWNRRDELDNTDQKD